MASEEINEPVPPPLPVANAAPSAPPPLPASVLDSQSSAFLQGRLHPFTLLFTAWHAVRNVVIPLLVLLLWGRKGSEDTYLLLGLVLVGIPIVLSVLRYFTFTYRIQNGELITKHGVLGRIERNIPLSRVQDIRIEQGVLHRVFRVAEVYVETAGGKGAEASLSVLSRVEAERLRAGVFAQRPSRMPPAVADAATPATPVARETVRQLSVRELMLAGVTSNHMASALVLVLIAWQKLDEILPQKTYERLVLTLSEATARWVAQGAHTSWVVVTAGALLLVLAGAALSMAGSVVLFYGFTLSRSGEDLHRAYGLLTRRSSSLPRRRIQVLKIEETWLRRLFRLVTLRADTAGSEAGHGSEGRGGRDVLLPILPRARVEGLLPVFFPDWETGLADWRQVSRRAVRRGTVKGSLVCALAATVLFLFQRSFMALWPLLFVPLVYALNVLSYRYLGYCLGERYFRTRRGWLSRATQLVPIRNAQTVVIRQTPLDRWHRVATVLVDTAGQAYTGGGPRIHNVPWAEAVSLAQTLAQQAAATRYRW